MKEYKLVSSLMSQTNSFMFSYFIFLFLSFLIKPLQVFFIYNYLNFFKWSSLYDKLIYYTFFTSLLSILLKQFSRSFLHKLFFDQCCVDADSYLTAFSSCKNQLGRPGHQCIATSIKTFNTCLFPAVCFNTSTVINFAA